MSGRTASAPSNLRTERTLILRLIVTVIGLALAGQSLALDVATDSLASAWPPQAIYRGATLADDLTFPDAAETASGVTSPRMALLKPPGEGPFPAVVMVHQCAGLNPAVLARARKAVSMNYVVLLIDSLGPRGVTTVCYGPKEGVKNICAVSPLSTRIASPLSDFHGEPWLACWRPVRTMSRH